MEQITHLITQMKHIQVSYSCSRNIKVLLYIITFTLFHSRNRISFTESCFTWRTGPKTFSLQNYSFDSKYIHSMLRTIRNIINFFECDFSPISLCENDCLFPKYIPSKLKKIGTLILWLFFGLILLVVGLIVRVNSYF